MKHLFLTLTVLLSVGCSKVDIVAHRGFWNTEATGFSENSIASLEQACKEKIQGCELDIHTTADGVIIVNHDSEINGKRISDCTYSEFENDLLPNGEVRPTLDSYLEIASAYPSTRLVIEFKNGDNGIVENAVSLLKKYGMYSPDRAMFISFSLDVCKKVADLYPEFGNQYLGGDIPPKQLSLYGINGIDCNNGCFREHPEWVKEAHDLKMSVNVWTVDDSVTMKEMIDLGVDAITTNEPLLLRSVL